MGEKDKSSGIGIIGTVPADPSQKVDIAGRVEVVDGEKVLQLLEYKVNTGTDIVPAMYVLARDLGGGDHEYNPLTGAGQQGVLDLPGKYSQAVNNIGLLVNVLGEVKYVASSYFYISDGSAVDDGSGYPGVKIVGTIPGLGPHTGKHVLVTGISSCFQTGTDLRRLVRARNIAVVD